MKEDKKISNDKKHEVFFKDYEIKIKNRMINNKRGEKDLFVLLLILILS